MNSLLEQTKWNANLYDDKHSFVFKYGEDLVKVLKAREGENILDVGCGTGYLTNLIAGSGAYVTGIDNSKEMIAKAEYQYPNIEFKLVAADNFDFKHSFDAVFSNATLHWVLNKQEAIDSIYKSLKPGGRFIMEMGGKDNVKNIINALKITLLKHGFAKQSGMKVWYFPSLSEYTSLLESKGFRVTYASHYDRETKLKDSVNGIKDWLKMFGGTFLKDIDENVVDEIMTEVQDLLRPTHFRNGNWFADYKRLRVVAIKK